MLLRVTFAGLKLEDNSLDGTVPTELRSMEYLEVLTLGDNKLEGELSPWLTSDFVELQGLCLSNNNFHGPIPDALGNLTALTALYLDGNLFTGSVPEGLCSSDGNPAGELDVFVAKCGDTNPELICGCCDSGDTCDITHDTGHGEVESHLFSSLLEDEF